MAAELSRDDVVRAREAIAGRLHRTPVFSSATLGERTGAPVHLKGELFQRTGSFKPRGVLTKLASLSEEEKRRGVIGISAGNHAQALAYCAALEGVSALVVMWTGASAQKVEATRAYGAAVDLEADGPGGAFDRLAELLEETGRALVHPFDDPLVIAGQGTVGLEILEDVPDAAVIVVPVGGGGLVSGIGGGRGPAGDRGRAGGLGRAASRARCRAPGAYRAAVAGGRAERAIRRRASDPDLPSPRGRERARLRGGARRGDALPLRPSKARLRARRRGRRRSSARRQGRAGRA